MATLMSVTHGGKTRRCTATCYNATSKPKTCDCVCGSANHGRGEETALEDTREMAEGWMERYAEQKGLDDWRGEVGKEVLQASLLELLAVLPGGEVDGES